MGSPMQQAAAAPCDKELRGSSWHSACRYPEGHVHSHAHRYMTCSRPWTVDHGTARRALFCRLLFKQACSCLAVGSAFLPSKTQMIAAPSDPDATRDSFFSSRGGSSRFVLSRSPSDQDLLTLHKVHNGESGQQDSKSCWREQDTLEMATSAYHLAVITPPGLKIGPSRIRGGPWREEIWAGGRQLQASSAV